MKQKRQSRASQKSCRSAATRISSSTAGCRPHEPALLLDKARRRPRSTRGSGVIGLAAQQGDRALRVETPQFLATYLLEPGSGLLPDLNPPLARGDLHGTPARQVVALHRFIVAAGVDLPTWATNAGPAPTGPLTAPCPDPAREPAAAAPAPAAPAPSRHLGRGAPPPPLPSTRPPPTREPAPRPPAATTGARAAAPAEPDYVDAPRPNRPDAATSHPPPLPVEPGARATWPASATGWTAGGSNVVRNSDPPPRTGRPGRGRSSVRHGRPALSAGSAGSSPGSRGPAR